jgi:hypothetical protein
MTKISGCFALIGWFWNNSDNFLKLQNAVQEQLPQIVKVLRWSADSMDRLNSLETKLVSMMSEAERPLAQIPSAQFNSKGFYEALNDALSKLHVVIVEPSEDIRNELNKVRLLTISSLEVNAANLPLAGTWHSRAHDLLNEVNAPNNPIKYSANALREIAEILETAQQ